MYFLSVNKIKEGADRRTIRNSIRQYIQCLKQMIVREALAGGQMGNASGIATTRAKDLAEPGIS